ncbi:MAG TPA: isoleucine--tRNA ligase, partial [Nitrospirae bacterium]|nr:isoleucine--tRNA ligase [Nitrospirota bacterium]
EVENEYIDEELIRTWGELLNIRNEVNKALEIKRQQKFIGNSLEATVSLYVNDKDFGILEEHKAFLADLFIVSSAEIFKGKDPHEGSYVSPERSGLAVLVEKASGEKCSRCWNWSEKVGTFKDHPELCDKCHAVLEN